MNQIIGVNVSSFFLHFEENKLLKVKIKSTSGDVIRNFCLNLSTLEVTNLLKKNKTHSIWT